MLALRGLAGWDSSGKEFSFETFHKQHNKISNELSFSSIAPRRLESIFEVGCGGGAELFMFREDGLKVGGIDYSSDLIRIARGIFGGECEFVCGDALDTPTGTKYDAVMSYGAFMYFPSYEYTGKVLEMMYDKSNYSIGLIDILDLKKKEACVKYRSSVVENYAEKYAGLDKLFFSKDFFIDFADSHGLNIRFSQLPIPGYWNSDFVYHVFMTRE